MRVGLLPPVPDYVHLDSSLLLQGSNRSGAGSFAYGMARLDASLSILDLGHSDVLLSLRGLCHMSEVMPVYGLAHCDVVMLVPDLILLGSFVSARSMG